MKRFIALIIMLLPLLAMAQQPDFSKLTKRYANNDKVTIISLTQQQLLLFMGGGDGAEDIKGIDTITIMMTEDKAIGEDIFKAAAKAIKRLKAEELVSTTDEESNVSVYTTSSENMITSVIVTIVDDGESGLVVINGEFPVEKLNDLVKVDSSKLNL